ncbi:hypothetical protein HAX54_001673 [Datura stramonium]|uniref:Uncharacterized protein n=1 Tax=Datura stramonium TaxID=4076 RepID=A0ABS8T476_DATST|nr:hypothetical protein [Datura stramonium]
MVWVPILVIKKQVKALGNMNMGIKVETMSIHLIGEIEHLEERMNRLTSQIELKIGVDVNGPLAEKSTMNLECVVCCGENIFRSGKTLNNRVENVDEESGDKIMRQ